MLTKAKTCGMRGLLLGVAFGAPETAPREIPTTSRPAPGEEQGNRI
jgi:hypothetical protein